MPLILAGCFSKEDKSIHGYVEGEFIMVAPTSAGILDKIHITRGDRVKSGDPLFSLNLTDLKADKAISEADISRL